MMVGAPRDLPSWDPGDGIPAGLATGILRWDGQCVRLQTQEGPDWIVVWPEGTRLREDMVPPLVVDGSDRAIGYLGDTISLAGAPYPAGSWEQIRDRLIEDIPRECRDEAPWLGVPLNR
jgi:hypothetical protein